MGTLVSKKLLQKRNSGCWTYQAVLILPWEREAAVKGGITC